MTMPPINPHIFRAYDIRGKYGSDLTPDVYRLIGQAFGSILRELYKKDHPSVVVGRDMRPHSPALAQSLVEGLVSTGCEVLDMGLTPSPVNYFLITSRKLDGGVQVTASHNPTEDNGLKLQIRDAVAFSGEDIQALYRRVQSGTFLTGKGSVQAVDAVTPYLASLAEKLQRCGDGMKVVIDTGNGTDGPVAMEALKNVGATPVGLYIEPDGTFPNHPADPSKRFTLKKLQETVVREGADVGFAFDGDGDRLGVVDEKGTIRTCDEILLFLAKDYLHRFPGAAVVFTVSMSSVLDSEIRKWGGKPVMTVVGHSFVEHEMLRTGAPLGGEQSGHFFLEDLAHGYDDALIVALKFLSILHAEGRPLSHILSEFPKVYVLQELRPTCPDDRKGAVVRSVIEHFKKEYPVIDIDGARIDFGDGAWANIRQANTSPKLSVCIEARSPEKLKDVESIVLTHLKNYAEIHFEEGT